MNNTRTNSNASKFNRHIRKKKSYKKHVILSSILVLAILVITAVAVLCVKFLSASPENIKVSTVPDLKGMELQEAKMLLEENGLTIRIVGSGNGSGDESTISWQGVPDGKDVPAKSAVDVWVTRSSDDFWKWTCADVTFEKLSASDISYTMEYTSDQIASDGLVTDVIISGSDAVVYINKTKKIEMPNICGMTEDEAVQKLNSLGIGYVKNMAADDEAASEEVLAQYPACGAMVDPGATALITVCSGKIKSPVFGITSDDTECVLTVGQSLILNVDISPQSSSLNIIQWTSADPSVASVEPTGKVTAVGEGYTEITALSEDGSHSVNFSVTVSDVVTGIEILGQPKTGWFVDDEFTLDGLRVDAFTIGGTRTDVTDLCTVNGVDLKNEGEGTFTVEYNDGGNTMSAEFDYICSVPTLELDTDSVMLGLKDRHTFKPTYSPEYAKITYTSSDESIATVSEDGVITGKKAGNCVVTADISGKVSRQCKVSVKSKIVYLTFDDGPNAHTNKILSCLDRHNVSATFFCIGNSRYKKTYKKIVDKGHALGLHSYSHSFSKCYASVDAFMKETKKLQDLMYESAGVRPMILRFPGGTDNTRAERDVMLGIVERVVSEGYSYFDWNCYSNDTSASANAQFCAERVLRSCNDSSEIVLMHNQSFTCDALDIIIPALKNRGYKFKTISLDTPPFRRNVRGKGH